jgi:hypothetical protein
MKSGLDIKVWGCVAFAHIPKEKRKKLDFKSRKCIFLGNEFHRKAYRLLDLEDNSIIISRDVVFHEHKPGGEELTDTIFSQETIQTFTHPEPRSIPSKIPADDNTPENFDDHDPEANMEPDTEEREDYNSDESSGPPSPASFKSGPLTPFPMSRPLQIWPWWLINGYGLK